MNSRSAVLLLATLAALVGNTFQQQRCVENLDIIFAVDGSNSMGLTNFVKQRNSLANLVNDLDIGDAQIRVGAVLFSYDVAAKVDLSGNKQDIITKIRGLDYPDEQTRTDLAIDEAVAMFARDGRGGSVPQLLMVITDGESTRPELTQASATYAKSLNISIFAVGVTRAVSRDELEQMATSPQQVVVTEDFESLERVLNDATNKACVNLECVDAQIDMVFVLDSSSSIGERNFQEMKDFVLDFLLFADVNNGNIRVGVLIYSSNAYVQFHLSTHNENKLALASAIRKIQYRPGSTNTAEAFKTVTDTMFTAANGDRSDIPNVVIYLSASQSDVNSAQTIQEAERARASGIQIYGVGIGLSQTRELDGIASRPLAENRFIISSFSYLEPIIDVVYDQFNKFCETPPPVPACYMGQTDIWMVVDVSAAAERQSQVQFTGDYAQLKNGLSELLGIIMDPSVSNPDVRVGLITYSDTASVVVDPTSPNSISDSERAIENLPGNVFRGGSNLPAALRLITTPPVASDYRSYVALVAPEEAFVNLAELEMETSRLKNLGYTIVTFAVKETDSLNRAGVISAGSGYDFFYYFNGYVDLEAATKNFTRDSLCGGPMGGDGLCADSGHKENGTGVVAHPADCDKYIQCYYKEENDYTLAVVRACPMGLHWHAENKTCAKPCEAMCPYDKCKEGCEPYKMEGACGAYWECSDGMSKPKCCQQFHAFVPGMGCLLDYTCEEHCGPEECNGICQKKPNWEEPAGYDVMLMDSHMGWMPRPCFYENFDIVDCECTSPRNKVCPADRMYDFTDATTMSAVENGTMEGIRASDVMVNGQAISLDSKSAVHVRVNHMENGQEPFTLQMRFRESETFSPYGEVLVSSGLNCGYGNSLLVSANDQFIFAEIRGSNGRSGKAKVPYKGIKQSSFKDLIVSYGKGLLSLSVMGDNKQYIARTKAPSGVCFQCGLDFGAGLNKLSFDGEIQKISVHSCTPAILY